jgi:hypothetical protein
MARRNSNSGEALLKGFHVDRKAKNDGIPTTGVHVSNAGRFAVFACPDTTCLTSIQPCTTRYIEVGRRD